MNKKSNVSKVPYVCYDLFARWLKAKNSNSKTPITGTRNSTILPIFVGFTFKIHNGKTWLNVLVNETMFGYKFGAFVPTRTFKKHGGSKVAVAKKKPGGKK